eukprot:10060104-Heterocapsa_arctica.AAC.1
MDKECGRTPKLKVRADEGHQGKGVNHTPVEENHARERGTEKYTARPRGTRAYPWGHNPHRIVSP